MPYETYEQSCHFQKFTELRLLLFSCSDTELRLVLFKEQFGRINWTVQRFC